MVDQGFFVFHEEGDLGFDFGDGLIDPEGSDVEERCDSSLFFY